MARIVVVAVVGQVAPALSIAPHRAAGAMEPDPPSGIAQVLLDRSGNPPRYGPNQPVVADGVISFVGDCKTRPGKAGLGINDAFQPWADIYVVPTGTATPGSRLTDVSGVPNAVFGGLGGGFFGEVLGYTGPGGNLGAGTYDIVVDECQDRNVDVEDTLFSPAFVVEIPLGVDPAVVGTAVKAQAEQLKAEYRDAAMTFDAILTGVATRKIRGEITLSFASDFSIALFQALSSTQMQDPRPAAVDVLRQKHRRIAGLAADPPDPAFQASVGLDGGAPVAGPHLSDPVIGPTLLAARAASVDAALLGALVTAVERHQGAAEVGNAGWMLAHARDAQELAAALEAHLPTSAAAMRALAAAVNAQPGSFVTLLNNLAERGERYLDGTSTVQEHRDGLNRGLTLEQVASGYAEFRQRFAALGAATSNKTAFVGTLDAMADELDAFALALPGLRAGLQPAIDALTGLPEPPAARPVADGGGPYATTAGSAVTLDGTGSLPGASPIASYAWDLDLDGAYDDATGPTPSFTPTVPGTAGVALLVTDETGATDMAVGFVDVGAGNLPPTVTATSPNPPTVGLAPGSPQTFSVTASDPEGGPLSIEWFLDGAAVATGPSYSHIAAAMPGTEHIEAVVTDGAGNQVSQPFAATTLGPDADGDGWRAPGDCDDTDSLVHGGRAEIIGNGKDDDCNPATSDTGDQPTVSGLSLNQPPSPSSGLFQEGDLVRGELGWSHPGRSSGATFSWTVDWGDGTTDSGTVSGTSFNATRIVVEHRFERAGIVEYTACVTAPGDLTGCRSRVVNVFASEPVLHPADIASWTVEDVGAYDPATPSTAGEWKLQPPSSSARQDRNQNYPSLLISDFELPNPGRIAFDVAVEGTGDDDGIGFALGLQPGEAVTTTGDWIHVVWYSNGGGGMTTVSRCADEGGVMPRVPAPPHQIVVSRQRGVGIPEEYGGVTYDFSDAVDPRCRDDQGGETLDAVTLGPPAAQSGGAWKIREIPERIGSLTAARRAELYHFDVAYSDQRLEVRLDGELVLEADAPPGDPFPLGRVALTASSQHAYRGVAHSPVPVVAAIEGSEATFTVPMADGGRVDRHTGIFDWGDGSPATTAAVTATVPYRWDVTAGHTYADSGPYEGRLCVDDVTDGVLSCTPVLADVANVAPTVGAGPDQVVTSTAALGAASFTDPGTADTHTATVDWGDGSGPQPATVVQAAGAGLVQGAHTYTADGTYAVEVCVADDDGGVGCDALDVEVRRTNVAPVALVGSAGPVSRGTPVSLAVGLTDENPDDAHTLTVDWGDGTGPQPVDIQDGGRFASGFAEHTYAAVGIYPVTVEACDAEACSTAQTSIEVTGTGGVAIEELTASGPTPEGGTIQVAVTASGSGPLTYSYDCDDDGNVDVDPSSSATATCIALDDPSQVVRVTVADAGGDSATASVVAVVTNVAPVVAVVAPAAAKAGDTVTVRVSWTDPAGAADAPYAWNVDVGGDGSIEASGTAGASPVDVAVTLPSPGSTVVSATVTDADGGAGTGSGTVAVAPRGPEVRVPRSMDDCKKNGWRTLTDHNGRRFKNQGDCVSYVATGGRNLAEG